MSLISLIRNLIDGSKSLEVTSLPTKGYFYPTGFEIKIKKAREEDIIEYEYKYDSDDLMEIVECVKKIVKSNTVFKHPYIFDDLKSVDIIYIFLEIVKFTTNQKIKIEFFNDEVSKIDFIEFSSNNFNYFNFEQMHKLYNELERVFEVEGYKFSMPSVGVENSLSQFLLSKSNKENSEKFSNYSYDFLFFLGGKNTLTFSEIENLITIFNFDMDDREIDKIKSIINSFIGMIGYQLKFKNYLIDVKANLNLEKIWKT
jgi:hypothetical protein